MKESKKDISIKLGILFYFCSILGYFYELILNYFYCGKIFSHGILNGPWLPIYGCGALLIMSLYRFHKKPLLIFVLAFFLTGFFEYLCGIVLLKFMKMRLWDYTGRFLNINGLVCFLSAFCFGIGGLIVTYVLYPFLNKIFPKINPKHLKVILGILTIIFLGDIIASIRK